MFRSRIYSFPVVWAPRPVAFNNMSVGKSLRGTTWISTCSPFFFFIRSSGDQHFALAATIVSALVNDCVTATLFRFVIFVFRPIVACHVFPSLPRPMSEVTGRSARLPFIPLPSALPHRYVCLCTCRPLCYPLAITPWNTVSVYRFANVDHHLPHATVLYSSQRLLLDDWLLRTNYSMTVPFVSACRFWKLLIVVHFK